MLHRGEAHQYYRPSMRAQLRGAGQDPAEGYHFTADMTDKAIKWVHQQKALMGDNRSSCTRPGSTHAPHHVPKEGPIDTRAFDGGWDALREQTLERQKALGVVPQDCTLTPRHEESRPGRTCPRSCCPSWRARWRSTRLLGVHGLPRGRLIEALDDLEVLDDTWSLHHRRTGASAREPSTARSTR